MKSLTYGTIPEFSEFKAAFDRECPHFVYEIGLIDSDARMFEATGLSIPNHHYGVQSLYSLVDSLCAIHEGHISHGEVYWTDEEMEWAGNLASSIMTTLGFEWV